MTELGLVLQSALQLLNIEFTLNGFTFTFWQIFLWGIVAAAVIWLIFYWVRD